jgi:hypothetical protein
MLNALSIKGKMLTMTMPAATLVPMNIPTWLGGIYEEGKKAGRWKSYEGMARTMGFTSGTTMFRWIKGERQPEPIHCVQLSIAFGVPLDDVLLMAGHGEDVRAMLSGLHNAGALLKK